MSSQPSGSAMMIRVPGSASAMPAARPPPPHGAISSGGARAELGLDLDADAALPLDDVGVVERGDQGRAALGRQPAGNLFPALAVAVVKDDVGAGEPGRRDLHRGASAGMTMVAAMPERRAARATPWA